MTSAEADVYGLPRKAQRIYVLRGMPYVPHFSARGWFVRPGRVDESMDDRSRSEAWLKCRGAAVDSALLWPRNYTKETT